MVSERYIRGFAERCEELGADPVQLLKTAGILSDSLIENIANAKLLSDITNEQLKSDIGPQSVDDDDDYETVSFKRRRKRKPEMSVVFDKSMSGANKADTDMLLTIARRVEERRRRK